MPRCAGEIDTGLGLGWTPPRPFRARIETPRLLIREYQLADAGQLFEAVSASRDHLLPWLPWARDGHGDVESSMHFITTQIMAVRALVGLNSVALGVFDRRNGRLLGGTGVHGVHRDTASAEAGYWVRRDAAGGGIATESTAHLLSWAFRAQADGGMGLQRIVISCSAENVKSRRIPEKLGLRQEVEQRRDYFVQGVGVSDRLGWGVLAEEWDCQQHKRRGT